MRCPAELPSVRVIIVDRSVKIKPQWKIEDVAGALCGHPRASAKRKGGRETLHARFPSCLLRAPPRGGRTRVSAKGYTSDAGLRRVPAERGDAFGKALFSPSAKGRKALPRTDARERRTRSDEAPDEARSGPASQESSLSLMRPESRESERSLFRTSKREGRERKG